MVAPIYKKKADEKKPVEKAADDKPAKKEYLGGDKEPGEGSAKREGAAKAAEEGDGEGGDADMEANERADMFKRHMSEHTDHHNNARETLKQMHKRHEKEIAAMNKAQSEKMMSAADGEATVAAGEAAPAAAAEE